MTTYGVFWLKITLPGPFFHAEVTVTSKFYVHMTYNIFHPELEEARAAVFYRKMGRHYSGALFYIHMLISISKTDG